MPPKKPVKPSIVGEYDLELMTEEELRMYLVALQEEHSRMRKARNLYSKDKIQLLTILKSTQENILNIQGIDIQKSLKIQELMIGEDQKLKYEDALNKIFELEEINKAEKDTLQTFITIKTAQMLNKEEEEAIIKDICERDREIQKLEFILEGIEVDLQENHFEKYHKLSNDCKDHLKNTVKEHSENFFRVVEEFSQNKIEKLQAIWEDSPRTDKNSFTNFIVQMNEYFKDIYWKNIKTVEELQSTLTDLKKELNTLTLNLRDVDEENNSLRECIRLPVSPTNSFAKSSPSFSQAKSKKLTDAMYENYLLTIKLHMLNKEHADLKEKFVSALRKIYQKADFKVFLLEQKLSALQNPPE